MTTERSPINPFLADAEPLKPEIAAAFGAVAETLGGDCRVEFQNSDKYSSGENRFLVGFTDVRDEKGFVKLCEKTELKQQLRRETDAMVFANKIGIPTIRVSSPYQETSQGIGIIHLEALDSQKGNNLGSAELIAGADPLLGKKAGEMLAGVVGRDISSEKDAAFLKRTDERNASLDSFWGKWKQAEAIVTSTEFGEVDPWLVETIKRAAQDLEPFLAETVTDGEYFVHNDVSPSNMYFDNVDDRVVLLDFEHAGATNNPRLAAITDLGNFYARCWPNPEMQKEYAKSLLENLKGRTSEETLTLVKGLMIFNTIYLAKFAMNPEHREHKMAEMLLKNLRENIQTVEEYYQTIAVKE